MGLIDIAVDITYAPQVEAAASRLDHAAARIRHRAGLLTAAAARCEWDGAGARSFRRSAHGTIIGLRRAAADLDDAAAALRRHAGRVADDVAAESAEQAAATERATQAWRHHLRELADLVGADRPGR